jgi:hypothetical protein
MFEARVAELAVGGAGQLVGSGHFCKPALIAADREIGGQQDQPGEFERSGNIDQQCAVYACRTRHRLLLHQQVSVEFRHQATVDEDRRAIVALITDRDALTGKQMNRAL